LICESLYLGLENVINQYRAKLVWACSTVKY
jgi:hypothetical protein